MRARPAQLRPIACLSAAMLLAWSQSRASPAGADSAITTTLSQSPPRTG